MILRPLLPEPADPIDTDADDARKRLAELYAPSGARSVRVNLIVSVDGTASDADGTSEGLGNRADRMILGAIRAVSDTVMIGAATLRAEGMIIPKRAHLTIVTGSGRLDGIETRDGLGPDRVLVVAPAAAEARARATFPVDFSFLGLGDGDRLRMPEVVAALHDRGLAHIVCEGGPQLAGQLVDDRLVDEFCVSISPQLVGGAFPPFGATRRDPVPLALAGLLADDAGGLYPRWRPRDRDPSAASHSRIAPSQRARS